MAKTAKLSMENPAVVLGTMMPDGTNDYCPKLINASIGTIKAAGKRLDARIHATACAIVSRANGDYHDASRMSELVNAMPKSVRQKALAAWFHHHTNFRMVADKAGVYAPAKQLGRDSKMWRDQLPLDAFDKPFWIVPEKDTDPAAFDDKALERMIAAIVTRADAEAKAGRSLALSADNVVHLNVIRAMRKAA